jgi:hypothetical protein
MNQPSSAPVRPHLSTNRTEELDRVVFNHVGDRTEVVDLCRRGFRTLTIQNSLARLLAAGLITSTWIGNEKYGRTFYSRVSS